MRIVVIYLGRKGAGPVYSLEFTRALLEQRAEVLCLISTYSENLKDWKSLEDTYKNSGRFDLIKVSTYQSKWQFLFSSLNLWKFLQLRQKILAFHPDVLLSTMVHPWHNIYYSLLKNKCKRVKIIHDVTPHLGENNIFYKFLNYWDIHASDNWVTLTHVAKEKLISKGISADKIVVIPHAHFGSYNKCNLKTCDDKINYRIGFFGRIYKYKGIDFLAQAYQEVYPKIPQLRLLIAGSGNLKDCDFTQGKVELYNRWITDDEVVRLLSKVDVVVLPYIEASQSGVVPLSFSLGKPVIVTNVGGLSEQVPSECGLVVPPNSVKAIEDAILSLYGNPQIIKQMGKSAYKYAHEQLTWKNSASLFLSAFS